jgi:hypothetical protein
MTYTPLSPPAVRRAPNGHWLAGQSANPLGRPKRVEQIADLALEQAPAAFAKIIAFIDHADPKIAMAAAVHVLDRAFGKCTQTTDATVKSADVTPLIRDLWLKTVQQPPGAVIDGEANTTNTTTTTPAAAATDLAVIALPHVEDSDATNEW